MKFLLSFCSRTNRRSVLVASFQWLTIATALVLSGCSSNGSSNKNSPPAPTVTAPTSLMYAVTALMATAGIAISPDTSTIQGSPVTYSVAPALPTGLALNSTSGTLSGTPTAPVAQTSYTITATNAAGSTTATVSITVIILAPTALTYPVTSVTDTLGLMMQPDVPTVAGMVSSFTIDPALPAGLAIDPATGAIAGTPSAFTPAAAYTVTAANSTGSTTAQLTVAVSASGQLLLEQGHGDPILTIRSTPTRLLSEDTSGHWVLWDYTSTNQLASGDGAATKDTSQVSLAGQLVAVATSTELQLYSAADGHAILTIPIPSWWKLASDGSYLCAGTTTSLIAWMPTGDIAFTLSGDYHAASAFAAPAQIQLAGGPSGANIIETDTFPGGHATLSSQFQGAFYQWFLDGNRFLTNLNNTVWVYSATAAQQALVTLPSVENLTGQGNWIWTTSASYPSEIMDIYAIGSSTPATIFPFGLSSTFIPSGSTVGVLEYGAGALSVVDLSTATPKRANYVLPHIANLDAFSASTAAQWITGTQRGVIVDGASLTTTSPTATASSTPSLSSIPRLFGLGEVLGITTTPTVTAISTAAGPLLLFNPTTQQQIASFPRFAGKIQLSADGTLLAAAVEALDAQYEPNRTLTLYSVPSAKPIKSYLSQFNNTGTPFLTDFTLSPSGTVLGQVEESIESTSGGVQFIDTVSTITDDSLIWTQTGTAQAFQAPILISPDGTLIATPTPTATPGDAANIATNIYLNGTLVTAVPGMAEGWIDNNHLLLANFTEMREGPDYTSYSIVDAAGNLLSSVQLPASGGGLPLLPTPDFPSPTAAYDARSNSIFSLATGLPIWKGPVTTSSDTGIGAAAGALVVYESGHQVVVSTASQANSSQSNQAVAR